MKNTKSNNNETFTGIRKLSKLADKSHKKISKKSSKKTNKRNKMDKETIEMMKIINSDSSVDNMNAQFQNMNMYQNKQKFKDVDMTLVNDFVPVDNNGNIVVKNRIADLFGPVQQLNNNFSQISNQNNLMSEADMNLFNNTMSQPALEMQVQQLNNMMGMQNQMGIKNPMQNMMGMQMPMQNMMGMQMPMQNMMGMQMQNQNMMSTMSPSLSLSPMNNMNNLNNLSGLFNVPKLA